MTESESGKQLVSEFDSFISSIASAPPHPLVSQLDALLPEAPEQVRAIQARDGIPGVVKRIIPLDAEISWEYWWCVPSRLLLPEDVELMKSDLARVESILEKLVWLFGGYCFSQNSVRLGEQLSVRNWQEVVKFAHQQGFESYLLDIDYLPTAIKPYHLPSDSTKDQLTTAYIAVEPPHWHVEFFQLVAVEGGWVIQEPKPVCSCQIWTGKPFIKHLETGETSTRYDLWLSTPLDITQPPWRS